MICITNVRPAAIRHPGTRALIQLHSSRPWEHWDDGEAEWVVILWQAPGREGPRVRGTRIRGAVLDVGTVIEGLLVPDDGSDSIPLPWTPDVGVAQSAPRDGK